MADKKKNPYAAPREAFDPAPAGSTEDPTTSQSVADRVAKGGTDLAKGVTHEVGMIPAESVSLSAKAIIKALETLRTEVNNVADLGVDATKLLNAHIDTALQPTHGLVSQAKRAIENTHTEASRTH